MNLALPALVILLGLLPGICCFYGYYAGRFEKRTAGVSGVEELALYVIFAVPIDAIALAICQRLGITLNFNVVAQLIAGGSLQPLSTTEVASAFANHWGLSASTYFTVLIASYAVGSIGRRTVWTLRLDTRVPILRLKHVWFYVLLGRDRNLPRDVIAYVDVLTEHPDGSRLYRGLVVDFEISSTGKIESLTLRDTMRGVGRGDDFRWKEIPSTRLSIMGSTIHSINVTYLYVEEPEIPWWPKFKARFHRCLRSFVFEES